MIEILINLKRFDVPGKFGGICTIDDPTAWIEEIIEGTYKSGIGFQENVRVVYFLPEGLIKPAADMLQNLNGQKASNIAIGSQGVYRGDIEPGGNFGAFTSNLPPKAAINLGAAWALVGHSEERKDKEDFLGEFTHQINQNIPLDNEIRKTVSKALNGSVNAGMRAGMNIVFCVGETAEERGKGSVQEQRERIEEVLTSQITDGLEGVTDYLNRELVIGYEPRWAIGPGKTPPDDIYIGYVSTLIKDICRKEFSKEYPVVYGGGLKEENAAMIAGVSTIDGGLIALTRFTGQIGFYADDLVKIVDKYIQ